MRSLTPNHAHIITVRGISLVVHVHCTQNGQLARIVKGHLQALAFRATILEPELHVLTLQPWELLPANNNQMEEKIRKYRNLCNQKISHTCTASGSVRPYIS